ncbi:zinc finger protein 862-like, partial [Saccoglossus kowalevskii]|uniref:DUF4371 domain-containing protein n=1 Tax=Saccoglossus kowalevskii TaxID=10224 RepID=A0ABM0MDT9_SACKO
TRGLIELLEASGVDELKYFEHRSRRSVREILITIEETIRELILDRLQNVNAFGLLADESTDVAVMEQMIIFVKYFGELCEAKTDFLAMTTIFKSDGANAEVLTNKIVHVLEECSLLILNLKSFVSDGAAVMTGKQNGVAARLRRLNKLILSFHCICHKLALACVDTEKEIGYIKEVATTLTQAWKFFENSPKRTNIQ